MSIAVDLDGTLAEYTGWNGKNHIGKPIPKMVERVKSWLKNGEKVYIFTARVSTTEMDAEEIGEVKFLIEKWCIEHIGQKLPITANKEQSFYEIWDDRAIQVAKNTGERVDEFR